MMAFFERRRQIEGPDTLFLTPTEWKALMDEVLSPLMERELGLIYLGGYLWAGPWEDHRRKIVQVFLINQAYGTLQWGWSFDFVPHVSGKKLAWHRTDKSARLDVWEVSRDFIKAGTRGDTRKRREAVVFSAYGPSRASVEDRHRRAFQTLLPLIRAYYAGTGTPERMLGSMETALGDSYYRFTQAVPLTVSAAFLAAALGRAERGKELLAGLDWTDEYRDTARLLEEKLAKQPQLWEGATSNDADH